MESKEFIDKIVKFVANSKDNYVSAEDAIHPGLVGMKIYEEPLVRFARADDGLFTEFNKGRNHSSGIPDAVGMASGCKNSDQLFLSIYKGDQEIKPK